MILYVNLAEEKDNMLNVLEADVAHVSVQTNSSNHNCPERLAYLHCRTGTSFTS